MEKRVHELYPNIKDCYIVNDQGVIWNENTGNKIKHKVETDGYVRVSLMKIGGGTTYVQLHRLLMMAFRPVEGMERLQVNHIDGNKENNTFDNLEWCTSKENLTHAIKTGLRDLNFLSGEGTNLASHSEEQAKQVIELLKTNNYTDKEIAEKVGVSARSFVARIRRKETWKYLTKDIEQPLGKPERASTFNTHK